MSTGTRILRHDTDDDEIEHEDRMPDTNGRAPVHERGISLADFAEGMRETRLKIAQKDARGRRQIMYLPITYDPNLVTDELSGHIQDMIDEGDHLAAAQGLCEVVVDWDLWGPLEGRVTRLDENDRIERDDHNRPIRETVQVVKQDEKVPLDPEIIQHIRSSIILGIWRGIHEDALGDDPNSQRRSQRPSRSRR